MKRKELEKILRTAAADRLKKEILQDIAEQDNWEVLEHDLKEFSDIVLAIARRIKTLKKR